MIPEEFTAFTDAMPTPNKHIIVTNNIDGKESGGEMSHVWMTKNVRESPNANEGLVCYTACGRVIKLTHWKYA